MEKLFTTVFWETLAQNAMKWVVTDLPGILILILVLIVALKVVRLLIRRISKSMTAHAEKDPNTDTGEAVKRINTLTGIVRSLLKVIVWAVILMMVLQKFAINIGPIIASAGILGLAIGFGAQELVRDFIAGFFMILENQIRTGDVAVINGTAGTVERIELRTITLRDLAGATHIFQNGKISTTSNLTKDWSAVVFDIGVAYKEDPEKVMEVMKQVGDTMYEDPEFHEKVLEPIEINGVNKFGDSAVEIRARIKTKPILQWAIGREYRKRLKKAFDENNIEIPFPHTTVYWGEKIKPLIMEVSAKDGTLRPEV
ncbi:MAG: mechanosensitive ion channel family protein [FCB group bacterium]|nr:mechanosensitive ion channel family protein [FCB group bacterium]